MNPKVKIHFDLVQGTPEWFAVRLGRMTASHAQAIGTNGKGLDTYLLDLAAERITGQAAESWTGNADTERGVELEDCARALYEWKFGEVNRVGFIEYGQYAGCSPDGLVGEDGGVEIKCPRPNKWLRVKIDGKIESAYNWQMQMNMIITGRKWWDYVVYNPAFNDPLIIMRVNSDAEKQQKILDGLAAGEKKIIEMEKFK